MTTLNFELAFLFPHTLKKIGLPTFCQCTNEWMLLAGLVLIVFLQLFYHELISVDETQQGKCLDCILYLLK